MKNLLPSEAVASKKSNGLFSLLKALLAGEPSNRLMKIYDSKSAHYKRTFELFLARTDQKVRLKNSLDYLIQNISDQRLFIDVGAGTGSITLHCSPKFKETIAIEPNLHLTTNLQQIPGKLTIVSRKISDIEQMPLSDLVLCSHVFHHIPPEEWAENTLKLASWLSKDGLLVIVLQNPRSDCMKMLDFFIGPRRNLEDLRKDLISHAGNKYKITLEKIPSRIRASSSEEAYLIAEFLLNVVHLQKPPKKLELQNYIDRHFFKDSQGEIQFSCDQDLLLISRQ